jgi:hypothetical protein
MSEELERELERALAGLPGSSDDARERARRSALEALPPAPARQRRWRGVALLAVAVAAVLAAAGVTLAATGAPPFADHNAHRTKPSDVVRPRIAHPSGVIATYVDGRLWLGASRGRRFSAVELSPGGLYAAVGEPGRLSVYTPDLTRRVWSQRVPGRVEAISWRPIGTQIAYIVHTAHGNRLYLIEGDGDHNQLVPTGKVDAVRPSWRWDSQAFAYVGAGGRAAVYDLVHQRSIALHVRCAAGAVESVAFAPPGSHQNWLAGSIARNDFVANATTGRVVCFMAQPDVIGLEPLPHFGWTLKGELLVAHNRWITRLGIEHGRVLSEGYAVAPNGVANLAPSPDGGDHMLVALIGMQALPVVVASLPPRSGHAALHVTGKLRPLSLASPGNARPQLIWR